MQSWVDMLKDRIHTLQGLKFIITVTAQEEAAIAAINTRWGTTPYFAGLMDKSDPVCRRTKKHPIPLTQAWKSD